MSTKQKSNRIHFWVVVLGLLLTIGLIAGGTYVLSEQGLISAGGGEMRDSGAPLAGFAAGEMGKRPSQSASCNVLAASCSFKAAARTA